MGKLTISWPVAAVIVAAIVGAVILGAMGKDAGTLLNLVMLALGALVYGKVSAVEQQTVYGKVSAVEQQTNGTMHRALDVLQAAPPPSSPPAPEQGTGGSSGTLPA